MSEISCTIKYWDIYAPLKSNKLQTAEPNKCNSDPVEVLVGNDVTTYEIEVTINGISQYNNIKLYFVYNKSNLYFLNSL